jgi:hypothetical protein
MVQIAISIRLFHATAERPYFDGVVNIGGSISPAFRHDSLVTAILALEDLPLDTDGVRVCLDVLLRLMVEERSSTIDSHLAAVRLVRGSDTGPEDDTVRPRVTRGNAMSEVKLGRIISDVAALHRSTLNESNIDSETLMALGRTVVVEIAVEAGSS